MPGACWEEYCLSVEEILVTGIRVCNDTKRTVFKNTIVEKFCPGIHRINKACVSPALVSCFCLIYGSFFKLVACHYKPIYGVPVICSTHCHGYISGSFNLG